MVTPPVKTRSRPQQAPKRAGVRPLIPPVPLFEKDLYLDSIKKRSSPKSSMEPSAPVPDMDIDMDLNMDMDTMQLDGPVNVDPCLVSEYQEEIFAYKRMLEVKKNQKGPKPPGFKSHQPTFLLFFSVQWTNSWVNFFSSSPLLLA